MSEWNEGSVIPILEISRETPKGLTVYSVPPGAQRGPTGHTAPPVPSQKSGVLISAA